MARRWYPVAPERTPKGALAVLVSRGIPESEALVVPSFNRPLGGSGTAEVGSFSLAELIELGVVRSNLAKVPTTSSVVVRELTVYEEVWRHDAEPGVIRGTRWGGGMRLTIEINSTQIPCGLTSKNVAALVSTSNADATYRIGTVGLDPCPLFDDIEMAGRFDRAALGRLKALEGRVRHYLQSHLDQIERQPISVLMARRCCAFSAGQGPS